MKLLKSVILGAVTVSSNPAKLTSEIPIGKLTATSDAKVAEIQPVPSAVESALAAGCDPNGIKPNAFQGGCVADVFCNEQAGYHIFNHFHFSTDTSGAAELKLIPECRPVTANITPGFTCGVDTTLATGTEVVIPNVPVTGYNFDARSIRLLKTGKYASLETALASHKLCEDEPERYTCENIDHFTDGCLSTLPSTNGLTRFTNAFSFADCAPEIIEHHEDDGWIEEYKIFIGYDDLSIDLPGGQKATLDVHKVSDIILSYLAYRRY